MTMPRLSLYRPEKGNDYKFIDKTIWEMFQVGGVDVLIHKYLGPGSSINDTPTTPTYSSTNPSQIQDLLFLENRDRKYEPDIFTLRGVYNIQDLDFNLSQFGLFLQNDTIFVTFHINDTIEKIGRKLIAGDVIELPHLKDDHALNDLQFALKRFYVIEEVTRAAEGFSATWYPHLYRAKCKPMVDSQEFKDILDGLADDTGEDGTTTLRDIMSTYEKEMQITQAVLDQAEADVPRSGFDTTSFYTLQTDAQGDSILTTVDSEVLDASVETQATDDAGNLLFDDEGNPVYVGSTASTMLLSAAQKGYRGYITQDGIPQNGAPFTAGIAFPNSPVEGQFALRTDYLPNRLFRYNGTRWVKQEDNVRMTMSNRGSHDGTVNQGLWTVGATYQKNDLVKFNNAEYVSKVNNNLGIRPSADIAKWQQIRVTQKTSFINNNTTNVIDGHNIEEKQSLSKALRPQADE
jgi:hypothetical protein